MSGRLILLPKKTWNVWGKSQRERVQRDEQKAKDAEDKLKEQEKNGMGDLVHHQLRARALKRLGLDPDAKNSSSSSSSASSSTSTKAKASLKQQPPSKTFSSVLDKRKTRVDVSRAGYKSREITRKFVADPMQGLERARAHKRKLRSIQEVQNKKQKMQSSGGPYIIDRHPVRPWKKSTTKR